LLVFMMKYFQALSFNFSAMLFVRNFMILAKSAVIFKWKDRLFRALEIAAIPKESALDALPYEF
jgi:hypothetical protein